MICIADIVCGLKFCFSIFVRRLDKIVLFISFPNINTLNFVLLESFYERVVVVVVVIVVVVDLSISITYLLLSL